MSVQDLYPESLVSQERVGRNSMAVRFMTRADRAIASRAAALLTPREIVRAGLSRLQTTTRKPHSLDAELDHSSLLECAATQQECRRDLGIPADSFLYIYSGNIGAAAGLDRFISAIVPRATDREIFLIAGSGSNLAACEEAARKCRAGKVLFHTRYPQTETSKVLKAADVLLLSTYGDQALASLPSKLIWYMLAARPILALASPESELDRVIRTAECGWVVSRTEELNTALDAVSATPKEERERRGEMGRRFAHQHFTEAACRRGCMRFSTRAFPSETHDRSSWVRLRHPFAIPGFLGLRHRCGDQFAWANLVSAATAGTQCQALHALEVSQHAPERARPRIRMARR